MLVEQNATCELPALYPVAFFEAKKGPDFHPGLMLKLIQFFKDQFPVVGVIPPVSGPGSVVPGSAAAAAAAAAASAFA